jgi:hypothetical protein
MAVTMGMSVSANQIAEFNPRIRQHSCVKPLFVTDQHYFAEALPKHEMYNWTTIQNFNNTISGRYR